MAHLRVLCEVVELAVQEAHDLGRLVVDDCLGLLVPEHWHCVLACTAAQNML